MIWDAIALTTQMGVSPMFPSPYVPRFIILVPMFPMFPSPYVSQKCSPVPLFPKLTLPSPCVPVSMFPSPCAPQSICFPVPIDVPQCLCSPNMFPSPYVPPTNSPIPRFPSPIPQKCFPFPIFPIHVLSADVPLKCFQSLCKYGLENTGTCELVGGT